MEKRILLTGNMPELEAMRLKKKLEAEDHTLEAQIAMVKEQLAQRNLMLKKDDDGYTSLDRLIEDYIRQSDGLFDRYQKRPNKAVDILISAMADGGFIEEGEDITEMERDAV